MHYSIIRREHEELHPVDTLIYGVMKNRIHYENMREENQMERIMTREVMDSRDTDRDPAIEVCIAFYNTS